MYSARHSHATYWRAGEHVRGGIGGVLPNDHCAEGGPVWETWRSLVQIGSKEAPAPGQEWLKYTGHWVEIGFPVTSEDFVTSGPFGPAFQPWWSDDDAMLK